MKVAFITRHTPSNYGSVLQTYATQKAIEALGHEAVCINYIRTDELPKNQAKTHLSISRWNKNAATRLLYYATQKPVFDAATKRFDIYRDKMLTLTDEMWNTPEQLAEKPPVADVYMTGSDQVWSPTCVGFDPAYFLTFAKPEQKYSYAASIAVKKYPENLKDEFTKRISDFQGYSVREKSGAEIVRELTGKNASVNIDPTLLLKSESWDKIASDEKREPYIFLFNVLKPNKLIDYAISLAEQKGLKILYLNNRQPVKHERIEYLNPITADKFIGLIKNAEYVCTNSFHGNAFSVIYGKKFVVETETAASTNIRSQELLEYLGLGDRILSSTHTPDIDAEYDLDSVQKLLDEERKKSAEYLSALV